MEELKKLYKAYQFISLAPMVLFVLMIFSFFKYKTTISYEKEFSFVFFASFIGFIFSLIFSISLYIRVKEGIEKDIFEKLKTKGFKIKRVGFNQIKLEQFIKELWIDKGVWGIDFNNEPSEDIDLSESDRKIRYK